MKLLKFILIFCCLSVCLATQPENYFKPGSIWEEHWINMENKPYIDSKHEYTAGEEITIKGKNYLEIKDDNGNYVGGIREEEGKVYAWLEAHGYYAKDFLLCDFTAEVGDVIKSDCPQGILMDPITIIKTDSIILFNGEKRKRLFTNKQTEWVEGIGSTMGLLNEAIHLVDNYNVPHLIRYFENEETLLYFNKSWCMDCPADGNIPKYFKPGCGWEEYSINMENEPYIAFTNGYMTYEEISIGGKNYLEIQNGKGEFVGGIREENGKIYAWLAIHKPNPVDFLLCDFTAEAGDVIESNCSQGMLMNPVTITKTDSITLLNGEKRKRLFTNLGTEWIEGIGSASGLLNEAIPLPSNYNVPHLIRYSENGEQLYLNKRWCLDCPADENTPKYFKPGCIWEEYWINEENEPYIALTDGYIAGEEITIDEKNYLEIKNGQGNYVGGIREEDGKLYAWLEVHGEDAKDFLLCDFTAEAGDVVKSNCPRGLLMNGFTITKTDSITLLNGEKRKRLFTDWNTEWIEGIGSTMGLFNEATSLFISNNTPHLIRYFENEETLLYLNKEWCLDCPPDENPEIGSNPDIRLYPNPTTGIINIQLPREFSRNWSPVKIYNPEGSCIQELNLLVENNTATLDISYLQPGIYYVELKYKDLKQTYKIIKL